MATGGATADHLHCSVCFEHYKGRNPRLLSCHHSFCEGCLRELVKYGQISCPKCREMTAVKDEDVTTLVMNFHILPQLEEKEINMDKKCQLCENEIACLKCEECNKLLCQDCANQHDRLKRFKDHRVENLCLKHFEGCSHICTQCTRPVCLKCLIFEHSEHEDCIVPYHDGIKEIRGKIDAVLSTAKEEIASIETLQKECELNIMKTQQTLTKYKFKQKEHDTKAKEALRVVQILEKHIDQADSVILNQTAALEKRNLLLDDLQKLQALKDPELLNHYFEQKESLHKYSNQFANAPATFASITPEEIIGSKSTLLYKPFCLANIMSNDSLKVERGISGSIVGDFSIIFADNKSKQVLQINTDGLVEETFNIQEDFGSIKSASVHGTSLYVAQSHGIVQIVDTDRPTCQINRYKPNNISTIRKICVVSHTKILCTDMEKGKVYQYDPHEESTKMVLEGVESPTYVNFMMTNDGVKYIITLEEKNILQVYDRSWNYEFTIGKGKGSSGGFLHVPCDSLCIDEGILVVDKCNNRVCLFSHNGEYIRDLLTLADGLLSPRGLAYKSPNLWIICTSRILCFRVRS